MGGIGLVTDNLNTYIHTPVRTYIYANAHTYICIHLQTIYAQNKTIHIYAAHNTHTERTQNAHTQHRIQNRIQDTRYNMQHIQDNTQNRTTENTDTDTNNHAQDTCTSITDNLYTYSVDFYHEYAYINNSNTIELYTISKD